jgi:hypothetical protein
MYRIVLLTLLTIATPAEAWFLVNKNEWSQMSRQAQLGYVMGLHDEKVTPMLSRPLGAAVEDDLLRCVGDLQLTSSDLVAIIDAEYREPSNWRQEPRGLFWRGLRKACLGNVNRYRTSRGQNPLPH